MTNPREQTLRERLAEAIYNASPIIGEDNHPVPWGELSGYPDSVPTKILYQEADAALSVFRECLESEAVNTPLYVAPEGTPHHEAYVEGWQSCLARLKSLGDSHD